MVWGLGTLLQKLHCLGPNPNFLLPGERGQIVQCVLGPSFTVYLMGMTLHGLESLRGLTKFVKHLEQCVAQSDSSENVRPYCHERQL
jgi:hypothetical protein